MKLSEMEKLKLGAVKLYVQHNISKLDEGDFEYVLAVFSSIENSIRGEMQSREEKKNAVKP